MNTVFTRSSSNLFANLGKSGPYDVKEITVEGSSSDTDVHHLGQRSTAAALQSHVHQHTLTTDDLIANSPVVDTLSVGGLCQNHLDL